MSIPDSIDEGAVFRHPLIYILLMASRHCRAPDRRRRKKQYFELVEQLLACVSHLYCIDSFARVFTTVFAVAPYRVE